MQVLFGHKGYGVMTQYFALIGSDIVFSVESRRSAFFPSVRGSWSQSGWGLTSLASTNRSYNVCRREHRSII